MRTKEEIEELEKENKTLKSVIKDYEEYFTSLTELIRKENIGTLNIEDVIRKVNLLEKALKKEFEDKDELMKKLTKNKGE